MTTTEAPRPRSRRSAPGTSLGVLAGAALWLVGSVAVLAVVAAATSGQRALFGALLGGAVVLLVFVFGAVGVGAVAGLMPATSLLMALLTYTLQLLALALFFVAFGESAAAQREVADTWLAAGMITGTLAWTAGQVVTTLRTPVEPWEPTGDDAPDTGAQAGAR